MVKVAVRDRVACAALAVANVGAGMYIASEPAYIGRDWFVSLLAAVGIVLALPAAISAVTGWASSWSDEGLFVNGVYFVFITALFALANHHSGWAAWGLTLVLAAATVAAFSLWFGFRRAEAAADDA